MVQFSGVNTAVHEQDFLMQFISQRLNLDPASALQHYLQNGRESAEKLKHIVQNELNLHTPFTMIDFASGYGMVARHYQTVMPQAQVTTCDIHADANAFNHEQFGFDTIQSMSVPEELGIDKQFDVLFTLSFFSHISDGYFFRWLLRLYQMVKPGGHFIFTTHGRVSSNYVLAPNQIAFNADSEQKDLEGQFYGTAYTHPSYVMNQVSQLHAHHPMTIRLYKEAHWWGHQDVFVIHKHAV